MIAFAAYLIAHISKPTTMSKPTHLENCFHKLNLTVILILFTV